MARKAARGRQKRRSSSSVARATTRTPKKTARLPRAAARTGRHASAARREAALLEHKTHDSGLDQARLGRVAHIEDDEDIDWLDDEEDPRSQIVEDDDEGES